MAPMLCRCSENDAAGLRRTWCRPARERVGQAIAGTPAGPTAGATEYAILVHRAIQEASFMADTPESPGANPPKSPGFLGISREEWPLVLVLLVVIVVVFGYIGWGPSQLQPMPPMTGMTSLPLPTETPGRP